MNIVVDDLGIIDEDVATRVLDNFVPGRIRLSLWFLDRESYHPFEWLSLVCPF